jgi:hypothetical protein
MTAASPVFVSDLRRAKLEQLRSSHHEFFPEEQLRKKHLRISNPRRLRQPLDLFKALYPEEQHEVTRKPDG